MKKILTVLAIVGLTATSAMAQNRPSREEMQARRAEAVEKQADRLAKDLGLKDDAKADFVATYKSYQNELMAVQAQGRRNQGGDRQRGEQADKKKLTDEEATKQLTEYFSRQEEQIAAQQKRLEVEKKYCAEFGKTLTPQQLVKIFGQRQGGNQRQGGQQRQGGFGGPQGGGRGGFGGPQGGGFGGGDF